jgi:hypothetical protein
MERTVEIPNNELTQFDLPRICVVTGATDNVEFKPVKFAWYPRWVALLVLCNLLIAVIVAAILTKRVKGELPFTEEAHRRWRTGQIAFGLSVVLALVTLFASIGFLVAETSSGVSQGIGLLLLLATFVIPTVVGLTMYRGRGPVVLKITDTHITLKLPNPAAAERISEHLVSGAAQPRMAPSVGRT